MASRTRRILEEFIHLYRDEPCLWQVKSKEYNDRHKKDVAYRKLVAKLQELEPAANRDDVIKKINNLRSSYRKEMKKVRASRRMLNGDGEIYMPKLWYFNLFNFLGESSATASSANGVPSNVDSDEDSLTKEPKIEFNVIESASDTNDIAYQSSGEESSKSDQDRHRDTATSRPSTSSNHIRTLSTLKRHHQFNSHANLASEILESMKSDIKRSRPAEDRPEIFGKHVTMVLRDCTRLQRILAEKLISDVLFEAELGTLSISHRLTRYSNSAEESRNNLEESMLNS